MMSKNEIRTNGRLRNPRQGIEPFDDLTSWTM